MSQRNQFFTNQSAGATSATFQFAGSTWILSAEASSWGGASLKLQAKGPNGTFIDIAGAVLTANGFFEFDAARGSEIQAVITGTPTGLYAIAVPI